MSNSNQPKRIGLTGGIGSGKSSAAKHFRQLGIDVFDADAIAHELTQTGHPNIAKIAEHFGESILTANGALDRKKLRHIIGTDVEANKWLTDLLHPQIYDRLMQESLNSTSPYCVLMIPLLAESPRDYQLDRVVVIDCPVAIQQARAQARDHSSEQAIADIVALQTSREKRLAIADDIITNDQDLQHLYEQIDLLHQRYIGM
jgi:dephospho-CoA kinase